MPAKCIPLSGSTSCPAFNASSVSTNPALFGDLYVSSVLFSADASMPCLTAVCSPFLQYVSDVAELDKQLDIYAKSLYVKKTYVDPTRSHLVSAC